MNNPVASKINWAAAITAAITLAASFGLPVTEETKNTILTVAGVVGPLAIMVFRTFFTKKP